ncbi:hypothetical protein C900_03309 [Fulvivirga imtechensis AK7]|uniref:Uncharacterized protein n=1 Tax=Fulvivirga imtechensis AK7 TaxID=1237149 RepID=L8JTN0_9BACT|nr:hypothetical protein [Fulvivirga imtechensis]ELR70874.1 hypothetical protein C900_03309 [Fulvivirga imtechensis AK7]
MNNLLKALDCENEEVVINAFMDRYSVSSEEARDIFTETKKWLWLAAQNKSHNKGGLLIDKSLLVIDEMWHTFLLHSKIYYEYCFNKLKTLVHHVPTTQAEKIQIAYDLQNNPQKNELYENRIKNQYALIYDQLGPETLIKWYDTLANKYTPEHLQAIKK